MTDKDIDTTSPILHSSIWHVLQYFKYSHLPKDLQEISKPFAELAYEMAMTHAGPEVTAGLRKLLEAKDCFVRAALHVNK